MATWPTKSTAKQVTAALPTCRRAWAATSIRRLACSTTSISSAACSARARPNVAGGSTDCGKPRGCRKQKVSLCCSLMHDPDLLILDEPTTGVDPLSRRQFWELIDSIRVRRPHMSVIVATPYMDEAD